MLRELLASFDVETGQAAQKLGGLTKTIDGVAGKLGGLVESFIGSEVVKGFGEFVKSQIEIGSRVNDLSERLGVGTGELQEFQLAAGLVGVEGEKAAQALGFLNKNMGEALDGNKTAVETFTKLGVAVKDGQGNVRELGDVIPELADKFAEMGSDQERTAVAMKLFGKSGAALLPLLKQGGDGLQEVHEKFVALGGGMREDFIKAADEAGDQIDLLKFGLQNWKSQIAFAILPTLTQFVTRLQGWVAWLIKMTHETNLAKYAVALFGTASAVAAVKASEGFAKFLGLLPKGQSFWKTVLGLGIWGLVVLAIAAVLLVAEDLYQLFNGGQSVIGDFVDSLFGVGTAREGIELFNGVVAHLIAAFAELTPVGQALLDLFSKIFGVPIPDLGSLLKILRDDFVGVLHTVIDALQTIFGLLGAIAKGDTLKALGKLGDIADKIGGKGFRSLLGLSADDNIPQKIEHVQGRSNASSFVGPPTAGGNGPVNVQQNNNITNQVTGVPDAAAAGKAVKNGTKDALGGVLQDTILGVF